jgi:hypothetical protein
MESVMPNLISRCWSQNPRDRPSLEEIFNELQASGWAILGKADAKAIEASLLEVIRQEDAQAVEASVLE